MSSRLVHLWSGVLLAVPMFIVGVTAVFIAHKDALGLKDMPVGFMPAGMEREHELRSVAQDASGQLWLGGQQGLFHLGADGQLERLADFEVRQLLAEGDSLWVASKEGLYRLEDGRFEERLDAEVHGIARLVDGRLMASVKDQGALHSADGRSWEPWTGNAALLAVQGDSPKPYTFGKLVMDLHTGKAFFGKQGEWLWIDVLGVTLALLGLTGVWVWWQSRRRAAF